MKRYILLIVISLSLALAGCGEIKNRKLYNLTDDFVEHVESNYRSSRNLLHASESKTEGRYVVTQIGRLINVKISENAADDEYTSLRDELKKHYKDNDKVKNVYICGGGTIMIDCRH